MATDLSQAALNSESLYEIVNGERVENPPMGVLAGTLATLLAGFINAHALPRRLGAAVVEVLFHLKEERPSRRPDVAFVAQERWSSVAALQEDPAEFPFPPSLAIEVVSPSNTAKEVEEKILEYFDAGVALVWIIHPMPRRIYVHRSVADVDVLGAADDLDGGTVIPGFRLKISDLFDAVDGVMVSS
jgi:Uma2 family endonuclease